MLCKHLDLGSTPITHTQARCDQSCAYNPSSVEDRDVRGLLIEDCPSCVEDGDDGGLLMGDHPSSVEDRDDGGLLMEDRPNSVEDGDEGGLLMEDCRLLPGSRFNEGTCLKVMRTLVFTFVLMGVEIPQVLSNSLWLP